MQLEVHELPDYASTGLVAGVTIGTFTVVSLPLALGITGGVGTGLTPRGLLLASSMLASTFFFFFFGTSRLTSPAPIGTAAADGVIDGGGTGGTSKDLF